MNALESVEKIWVFISVVVYLYLFSFVCSLIWKFFFFVMRKTWRLFATNQTSTSMVIEGNYIEPGANVSIENRSGNVRVKYINGEVVVNDKKFKGYSVETRGNDIYVDGNYVGKINE